MPKIGDSKTLKEAGKRIYDRAYKKAKAEALRKARKKRVEEIRKKAREAAEKKFGLTKSEKRAGRIKKAKKYAKGLSKNLEGVTSGFMDEPVKTVKKKTVKIKASKKKAKSSKKKKTTVRRKKPSAIKESTFIWDRNIGDMF